MLVIGLVVFGIMKMMRGRQTRRRAAWRPARLCRWRIRYTRLAVRPPAPATPHRRAIAQLPALMPSRTEVLLTQLQENSSNNPEAWANILRRWLAEEEAS